VVGDRVSITVSIGAAQACHDRNEGWRSCWRARRMPWNPVSMRAQLHNVRSGRAEMFAIIGIVLVIVSIIGGFLMEKATCWCSCNRLNC